MKVVLVRHGETDWNRERRMQGHSDIPLNSNGRKQARDLLRILPYTFDAVCSSDLARASETAEILAPGIPLQKTELLRERNLGELEGMLWPEVVAKCSHEKRALVNYGETQNDLETRLLRAYDQIAQLKEVNIVLVAGHGGALVALVRALVRTKRIDPGAVADKVGSSLRNCSLTVIQDGLLTQYGEALVDSLAPKREIL